MFRPTIVAIFRKVFSEGHITHFVNPVVRVNKLLLGNLSNTEGKGKGKGKTIPLQTWAGPEVSRG
jgi:hypothetical protein